MKSFAIAMMLVVVCAAAGAAGEEQRVLVAAPAIPSGLYNAVVAAFDVRLALPEVTVVVATEADMGKLALVFGGGDDDAASATIEVVGPYSDAVRFTALVGEASRDARTVFGTGALRAGPAAYLVVTPAGGAADPAVLVDFDETHAGVSKIVLPGAALRPVVASKYLPSVAAARAGVPDPAIVALVEAVEMANLNFTNYHLSYDFGSPNSRNSGAQGLVEAQLWVAQELAAMGLDVETHQHRPDHALNTIATLPGRTTGAKVIVGAHLDSRNNVNSDTSRPAPGADDNGSGSAAVLELARIITESGLQFEHDLVFALWTGEEQGLLGSRSYAQKIAGEGVDVVAYLNADMIGYRVAASSKLSLMNRYSDLALNDVVEAYSNIYLPDLEFGRTDACCSDQQAFYEVGYPSISYFEHEGGAGSYPCYHQECDEPTEIDFPMLTDNTRSLIASFAELGVLA